MQKLKQTLRLSSEQFDIYFAGFNKPEDQKDYHKWPSQLIDDVQNFINQDGPILLRLNDAALSNREVTKFELQQQLFEKVTSTFELNAKQYSQMDHQFMKNFIYSRAAKVLQISEREFKMEHGKRKNVQLQQAKELAFAFGRRYFKLPESATVTEFYHKWKGIGRFTDLLKDHFAANGVDPLQFAIIRRDAHSCAESRWNKYKDFVIAQKSQRSVDDIISEVMKLCVGDGMTESDKLGDRVQRLVNDAFAGKVEKPGEKE